MSPRSGGGGEPPGAAGGALRRSRPPAAPGPVLPAELAEALKAARTASGRSRREIADAVGITVQQLGRLESGQRPRPSLSPTPWVMSSPSIPQPPACWPPSRGPGSPGAERGPLPKAQ